MSRFPMVPFALFASTNCTKFCETQIQLSLCRVVPLDQLHSSASKQV